MPDQEVQKSFVMAEDRVSNMTTIQKIIWKAKLFCRAVTLFFLFLPSIVTYPMIYLAPDWWYSLFAYSVELAGPVFIKLAQYVSARGDLFSNELADKFAHLREHCRTHSIEETRQLFEESFGEDINTVFKFKKEPIASGSIG